MKTFPMPTALLGLSLLTLAGPPSPARATPPGRPAPARRLAPVPAGVTPKVGDRAANFTLKTPAGGAVSLASVLQRGQVVLVLLRGYPGYQCPFCTRQVAELMGHASDFENSYTQVVLVYPGPSDGLKARADEFVRGKTMPANFHLLLDPGYAFTNQYGLRWNAAGETAYPSTFVLDPQGKVKYVKVSREHGDRATSADILKALRS